MSESSQETSRSRPDRRRIDPRVALAILETIRSQDLPTEVLEDEDPSVTMPRRLGLSEVVNRQIGRYREDARKRRRLTDDELRDLIQLAIRRPDSEDIFFLAGRDLAGPGGNALHALLPDALGYVLARRRVRRRLRSLFGRPLGGFARGDFIFEGRALPFIQSDPGGDACAVVSGLCQGVVSRYLQPDPVVVHVACQARGDKVCRWSVQPAGDAAARAAGSTAVEGAEAPR